MLNVFLATLHASCGSLRRLTNSGPPEREVDDYRDGWHNAFDNLAAALCS